MLLELFFEFLLIGALSFGGGYGTLPLIEDAAVVRHEWLTATQLADLITLSEITPGPIALNAASFTGFTVGGIAGAVTATVGCVLPSCVLVACLAVLYTKYGSHPLFKNVLGAVKVVVCALIFSAFLTVFDTSVTDGGFNTAACLLFAGCFAIVMTKRFSPAAVILFSGVAGMLLL